MPLQTLKELFLDFTLRLLVVFSIACLLADIFGHLGVAIHGIIETDKVGQINRGRRWGKHILDGLNKIFEAPVGERKQ